MKRKGTTTFLENVQKMGYFDEMVMCFHFSPLGLTGKNTFMMGGINPKYYKGPLRYYSVKDSSYWKLYVSKIRIGATTLGFCKKGCYAFLDTGTSYISFPSIVKNDVSNAITDEYQLHFATSSELPKLMYDY